MIDTADFIALDSFLKREGVFTTGGQAKMAIQAGEVFVNGEIEMRRKKKLRAGDIVVVGSTRLVVDPH